MIRPSLSQTKVHVNSYLITDAKGRVGEQGYSSMWSFCYQVCVENLTCARVTCEAPIQVAHLPGYIGHSSPFVQRLLSLCFSHIIQPVPSFVVALGLSLFQSCESLGHWEPQNPVEEPLLVPEPSGPWRSPIFRWAQALSVIRATCWSSHTPLFWLQSCFNSFNKCVSVTGLISNQIIRGFLTIHSRGGVKVVWPIHKLES